MKAITTQIHNTLHVTDEQLQKVTRCQDPVTGAVFYEVESQSEPGVKYLVRWDHHFNIWRCCPLNSHPCGASMQGIVCWHLRAAAATEAIEQDAVESEAKAAATREARAVGRYGLKAYESEGFSLLKTA